MRNAEEILEKRKIIKTVPMRKEWLAIQDQVYKKIQELEETTNRLSYLRDKFWTTVKEDLEDFSDMRINTEDNAIEILKPLTKEIIED